MKYLLSVFLVFVSMHAAHARDISSQIHWELRYPLSLIGQFSSNKVNAGDTQSDFEYYLTPEYRADDWTARRDLNVDVNCLNDPHPVLCSEQNIGPDRLEYMLDRVNSNGGSGQKQTREFLREALIGTGSDYAQDTLGEGNSPKHIGRRYYRQQMGYNEVTLIYLSLIDYNKYKCIWKVNSSPEEEAPCSATLPYGIPRNSYKNRIKVRIKETGDTGFLSGKSLYIRERVILGFGDSFASGEGNPDIPAELTGKKDWSVTGVRAPKRGEGGTQSAAQWLDRNCHRSLLGSQQRAAIMYAARHPHDYTVYLGFACSGAETFEGVAGPYGGTRETSASQRQQLKLGNRFYYHMSQVNQAIMALCKDDLSLFENNVPVSPAMRAYKEYFNNRFSKANAYAELATQDAENPEAFLKCASGFYHKIDAILLSTGGNDAYFGPVLVNALAAEPLKSLGRLTGNLKSPDTAQKVIVGGINERVGKRYTLATNYAKLNAIFKKRLNAEGKKIILVQYPNPFLREDGETICAGSSTTGNSGLELFPIRGTSAVTQAEAKEAYAKLLLRLNDKIQKTAHLYGWSLANSHVPLTLPHGWCAQNKQSATPEEYLGVAKKPDQFNAYALTQRWFRTMNDTFIIQNQQKAKGEISIVDQLPIVGDLAKDFLKVYGMFHPNSYGAAAVADAYLTKLEEVLDN